MTQQEIRDALAKPFKPDEIEWRVQSAGQKDNKVWARVLAYVDSRAIMNRLDEVFGIGGWSNRIEELKNGSFLCHLSCKIDGEWITKCDGSDQTDIEAVKGGISGAIKRSAVLWGIGRYLYNLDADFAIIHEKGKHYQAGKKESYPPFRWDAPELPAWALPDGYNKPKTDDPIVKDIMSCKTQEELMSIWKKMDSTQKEAYKEAFTKRKNEIGG